MCSLLESWVQKTTWKLVLLYKKTKLPPPLYFFSISVWPLKRQETTMLPAVIFWHRTTSGLTEHMIETRANTHAFSYQAPPFYMCLWRNSSQVSMTAIPTLCKTKQTLRSRYFGWVCTTRRNTDCGFTATQHKHWWGNEVLTATHSKGLTANRGTRAE